MKRALFKLTLFLLLGSIVNVAVAWGSAMWSPLGLPITRADWTVDFLGFGYARHAEKIQMIESSAIGASDPISANYGPNQIPSFEITLIRRATAGWPLYCMKCDVNPDPFVIVGAIIPIEVENKSTLSEINIWKYGISIPQSLQWFRWSTKREIPLRPIWPGFVINTVCYTVFLLLLTLGPLSFRNIIRRKRGLCIKCAYDLRGTEHNVCPECGCQRKDKELELTEQSG